MKSPHRWAIHRHAGERAKVYVKPADSRAEARRRFAKYTRWGLARKSWGWFMKTLFRRSMSSQNPRAKIDGRMVDGFLREVETGANPRVEVLIVNKLDYIRSALAENAFEESMRKATNRINGLLDRRLLEAGRDFDK